jgi:hypothetical protein
MVRWFSRREEVRVPDHGMHEIFSIYFAFGEGRLFMWVAWKVDVCFIFFEVQKKKEQSCMLRSRCRESRGYRRLIACHDQSVHA